MPTLLPSILAAAVAQVPGLPFSFGPPNAWNVLLGLLGAGGGLSAWLSYRATVRVKELDVQSAANARYEAEKDRLYKRIEALEARLDDAMGKVQAADARATAAIARAAAAEAEAGEYRRRLALAVPIEQALHPRPVPG